MTLLCSVLSTALLGHISSVALTGVGAGRSASLGGFAACCLEEECIDNFPIDVCLATGGEPQPEGVACNDEPCFNEESCPPTVPISAELISIHPGVDTWRLYAEMANPTDKVLAVSGDALFSQLSLHLVTIYPLVFLRLLRLPRDDWVYHPCQGQTMHVQS